MRHFGLYSAILCVLLALVNVPGMIISGNPASFAAFVFCLLMAAFNLFLWRVLND